MDDFKYQNLKTTVARQRAIQKLYAAKCRVASYEPELTVEEMEHQSLGDSTLMQGEIRAMSKNILVTKGMLKIQTEQEKYDKIFSKYTLTPAELEAKKRDLKQHLNRSIEERIRDRDRAFDPETGYGRIKLRWADRAHRAIIRKMQGKSSLPNSEEQSVETVKSSGGGYQNALSHSFITSPHIMSNTLLNTIKSDQDTVQILSPRRPEDYKNQGVRQVDFKSPRTRKLGPIAIKDNSNKKTGGQDEEKHLKQKDKPTQSKKMQISFRGDSIQTDGEVSSENYEHIIQRIQRAGHGLILPKELDKLRQIFSNNQDEQWRESSPVFKHFNNRVPVSEMIKIIIQDTNWCVRADKTQNDKIL